MQCSQRSAAAIGDDQVECHDEREVQDWPEKINLTGFPAQVPGGGDVAAGTIDCKKQPVSQEFYLFNLRSHMFSPLATEGEKKKKAKRSQNKHSTD